MYDQNGMKNLVFLKQFSVKNPTLDEQNDFMMNEVFIEMECASLGEMYDNDKLYGKELEIFIPQEVRANVVS